MWTAVDPPLKDNLTAPASILASLMDSDMHPYSMVVFSRDVTSLRVQPVICAHTTHPVFRRMARRAGSARYIPSRAGNLVDIVVSALRHILPDSPRTGRPKDVEISSTFTKLYLETSVSHTNTYDKSSRCKDVASLIIELVASSPKLRTEPSVKPSTTPASLITTPAKTETVESKAWLSARPSPRMPALSRCGECTTPPVRHV